MKRPTEILAIIRIEKKDRSTGWLPKRSISEKTPKLVTPPRKGRLC